MKIVHKYSRQYLKASGSACPADIQSIVHDSSNWYFTQNSTLWKFPFGGSPVHTEYLGKAKGIMNASIPDDLKNHGYNRFGDLYYFKGYLFVPLINQVYLPTMIAIFRASDLNYVGRFPLWRRDINAYQFEAYFDTGIPPEIHQRANDIMLEEDLGGDEDLYFEQYNLMMN